jgi:hypothetical protein
MRATVQSRTLHRVSDATQQIAVIPCEQRAHVRFPRSSQEHLAGAKLAPAKDTRPSGDWGSAEGRGHARPCILHLIGIAPFRHGCPVRRAKALQRGLKCIGNWFRRGMGLQRNQHPLRIFLIASTNVSVTISMGSLLCMASSTPLRTTRQPLFEQRADIQNESELEN